MKNPGCPPRQPGLIRHVGATWQSRRVCFGVPLPILCGPVHGHGKIGGGFLVVENQNWPIRIDRHTENPGCRSIRPMLVSRVHQSIPF